MGLAKQGFVGKRASAVAAVPEWEQLRAAGREIKEHTLAHLDWYLERFEAKVRENGGHVHWASTAEEACRIVVDLCRAAGARRVTKGKSMVAEEIGLNEALADAGLERVETDLGEYIIQLADEPPSHIIAPAVHKTKDQVSDLFHRHHRQYGLTERQTEGPALVAEAREVLREKFLTADVGITGANFLVAETGSTVIVTNEGNGDLTNTLPRVHIVTAGIEKVIPTLDDTATILRLLARSATGQEMSVYTTFSTGPRRASDLDGPSEMHVVLIDNGRSQMLGNEFHHMLRCIRCGACMNHCPVYTAVGGHTYGWVYVGPMGSVLTPLMIGIEDSGHLPNACTMNGRCAEVCPMQIPLPDLLRVHRERQHASRLDAPRARMMLRAWAFLARRPALYRRVVDLGARALAMLGRRRGRLRWLPLAGGWTGSRDLPAPQGETFTRAWRAGRRPR
ncbi:MAG: iron-sulfur cluster-binding protein [Ectothiorhodospiraceae bacterium]|nr:iron-sulfur cluster-binding protein [Chromatiales bacterium]MCP5157025.1 iron-sulfur cluster-binding protein [Ectothiorhodospiraceae bacterium]